MATTSTTPSLSAEQRAALAVLGLMIAQTQAPGPNVARESWITRRTDRVDLLGEQSVRYTVQLKIDLPTDVLGIETASAPIIPLTTIRRGTKLRALELRDEHGSQVPLATPEQCGALAVRGLRTYADVMLAVSQPAYPGHATTLNDRVSEDLRHIALDTSRSAQAWERFQTAANATATPVGEEDYQRWLIMTLSDAGRDISLRSVLYELTRNFALSADIDGSHAAGKRIFALSWTHALPDLDRSFWSWLKLRMAWTEIKLAIPVDVGRTRNYVMEMAPPTDDLAIEWGGLAVTAADPGTELPVSRYRDCDDRSPAQLRFAMRVLPAGGSVPPDASATFAIRPNRVGFLMIAWVACALNAVLLTVASVWRVEFGSGGGGVSTLLLFVPGLLSVFLIRPGEHPVASRFFSGVRVVVMTSAGCVLAAVGIISVELDPGLRDAAWNALPVVPGLAAVAVTFSVLRFVHRPAIGDETGRGGAAASTANEPDPKRRHPQLATVMLVTLILAGTAAVGVSRVGLDNLSVGGRLQAALGKAGAAPGKSGHGRLALASFARLPWSRMYIFKAGTPRDEMVGVVGEAKVSRGEQHDHALPDSVDDDEALVVLVDHEAVRATIELPTSKVLVTSAAYPTQCFLRASDVLRVRNATKERAEPRTVSVATPDPDCDR